MIDTDDNDRVEAVAKRREVNCPRCHEQCGWCSDYRHMHGLLTLPGGTRRRCEIAAMAPDVDCQVCGGVMKVLETITYSRITAALLRDASL